MADSLLTNSGLSSQSYILNHINLSSYFITSNLWENSFQNAKYGIFLLMHRANGYHDYYAIAHCNVGESTDIQCKYSFANGVGARIELHSNYVTLAKLDENNVGFSGVSAIIYYE